jgi:cytochrome P450
MLIQSLTSTFPFMQGKGDLFTRFMVLNEEGDQQFTDKNFRDTLLNFLIAGRDTTAVTLSWFVYMMTLHPHVAQKVFEELRNFEDTETADLNKADISNKDCQGEEHFNQRIVKFSELLVFDSLLKLPYMHACILETLRLYPAVPMVRFCHLMMHWAGRGR